MNDFRHYINKDMQQTKLNMPHKSDSGANLESSTDESKQNISAARRIQQAWRQRHPKCLAASNPSSYCKYAPNSASVHTHTSQSWLNRQAGTDVPLWLSELIHSAAFTAKDDQIHFMFNQHFKQQQKIAIELLQNSHKDTEVAGELLTAGRLTLGGGKLLLNTTTQNKPLEDLQTAIMRGS